jgi:hypothetical protein
MTAHGGMKAYFHAWNEIGVSGQLHLAAVRGALCGPHRGDNKCSQLPGLNPNSAVIPDQNAPSGDRKPQDMVTEMTS